MSSPELDSALQAMLNEAHDVDDPRFASGFADRVLERIASERAAARHSVAAALNRQAMRVLPALIAASLALVAWNLGTADTSVDSPIAAALGLPPVTVAAAVGSGVMLGAESLQ